jgi:hypothetical protein
VTEFWLILRFTNFSILVCCLLLFLYKGVATFRNTKESDWIIFTLMLWVALAVWSISEIIYLHEEGGPRVVLQTIVALFTSWVVIFKTSVRR